MRAVSNKVKQKNITCKIKNSTIYDNLLKKCLIICRQNYEAMSDFKKIGPVIDVSND